MVQIEQSLMESESLFQKLLVGFDLEQSNQEDLLFEPLIQEVGFLLKFEGYNNCCKEDLNYLGNSERS